ncbi:MAG: 2-oxo acid dehydrogenase subunit E2 [Bacillota bacterium]
MPTLTLPQAGKSTAGTIRRWRKKAGETVHKSDVILEIETDEGLAEVASPQDGTLAQILVPEGKTIPVKTAIAILTDAGPAASTRTKSETQTNTKPAAKEVNVSSSKPAPAGKVIPIVMPKAGQSMEEGTLVKWHVQPGATIQKGQVIFEIETDKANMDVEATDAGRLARIVLQEGQTLKVLEPVAYLADNDADVDAFIAAQGTGASAPSTSDLPTPTPGAERSDAPDSSPVRNSPLTDSGRPKASPAARKVAAERGIDLSSVGMGSGPGGRIISTDVPLAAPLRSAPAAAPVASPAPAAPSADGIIRRKLNTMRKAIAKNLQFSKQTVPHFYIRATVNADPLMSFYQGEKAKYPCSINDVVVLACAKAIRQFPAFRSRIEGDEIVELPSVNVGIAVGVPDGLVVPVVQNVDQLTLQQLGSESKRIVLAARNGKIEGMGKGVFTISNMGMFGVEEFTAIVNPPESAILAVGATREQVIVSGGTMRPGRVMTLTLSVDHRIIDGMLAAKFMARLKELLEWPAQMM